MTEKTFKQSQKEGAEEFGFLWLGVQRNVLAEAEEKGFAPEKHKVLLASIILDTMRAMKAHYEAEQ